jgi:hypothetical protein
MAVPSACRQHELVFGYVDLHRVNRACPQTLDGVTSKTKASRAQFVLPSASQPMVRELNRLEFDVFEVNPESRALSASEPIVLGVPSLPNISCLMAGVGTLLHSFAVFNQDEILRVVVSLETGTLAPLDLSNSPFNPHLAHSPI